MKQHVKEFFARGYFWNPDRSAGPDGRQIKTLDKCINDYMDEWASKNVGYLTIASVHTVEKSYQMDDGSQTFVLVAFNENAMSDFERKRLLAEQMSIPK